jgi:lipoprotein NlpI
VRLTLILIVLFLTAPVLVRADDAPAVAAFIRASQRQEKGDLDGALADYTRAIEIDPHYAEAYFNRGLVKHAKGDTDGALADFTRAIEISPGNADFYDNRASVRYERGDLDGAIADVTHSIEMRPHYPKAYVNRAVVKKAKNDLDGALADYTRAIEIDPRYAEAYFSRGLVKWNLRDFAGAVPDLRKALEIDPANDYARFFLFLAQAIGPDGETAAAKTLTAGLAARGKPIEKGSWVGTLDRFLRSEIAVEGLEEAARASSEAERSGNLCEAYFYGGMVTWVRGDKARATALLDKCLATKKEDFNEYTAARAVLKWPK